MNLSELKSAEGSRKNNWRKAEVMLQAMERQQAEVIKDKEHVLVLVERQDLKVDKCLYIEDFQKRF